MVSRQSAATPGALALQCGDEKISYAELDAASNRLARYVHRAGVGHETPVGVYMERSTAFVTAALAIMKAGGAYLPLDPSWPAERISGILRDAGAPVLISHRWKPAGLPPGPWNTVDLDISAPEIAACSSDAFESDISDGQLAYIIYTSGSTGRPKGVEITHANLTSLVKWHVAEFHVTGDDRASQMAGLGFDAAVWEIWPYLASGSSLHIIDEESRRSSETLRAWLVKEQISIAFVPTAMAEELITSPWPAAKLRWLLTGGDALRRYPDPSLPFKVINNYGPTECTVLATSGRVRSTVSESKPPSIGRPIATAEIYILDEQLRPVANGAAGEICIAGRGVGRGYRNAPELTAAKFIPNPFGTGRLYRTGDRGRLLSDGEIAFLGRIDDQIKIRGYRIEPEEIVVALNEHPQVRSSVVLAHEGELVAYVVPVAGSALAASTLKEFLLSKLPDYMIPSTFVRLSELPLTTSGKIDKTALPQPAAIQESGGGDIMSRVLAIVGNLVKADNISPDDNFFLAGGHSMLAAQLLVRVRQEFGVSLTLRQLFQAPTVGKLSEEITCHSLTRT